MNGFEGRINRIREFRARNGRDPDDSEYLEIAGRVRVGSRYDRWC